ncbi:hypothetical protein Btru_038994 [Bulinus truncatus]|nr:hypothetical protein Btru_038994 [Bulinus truncatus]
MNSLIALAELRSAKNRKLQEKSQCEEIKRQLVTISEHKVSGTTIPYFIDVQSLLNQSKHLSLSQQMDTIGHKINAYIRRIGELEYVKNELKNLVAVCETDEPVTNVQLILNKDGYPRNKLFIFMLYPSIDALLPETVRIAPDNLDISESAMTDLSRELEEHPLSVALSALVPDSYFI